jgi:hypothetical protein
MRQPTTQGHRDWLAGGRAMTDNSSASMFLEAASSPGAAGFVSRSLAAHRSICSTEPFK